jgi:predicted lipoprotein with Yx(FWY)xxD motif
VRSLPKFLLPTLAASLLLAACGSSSSSSTTSAASSSASTSTASSSQSSGSTVKTASISSVGGTVLVDAQGMTLYHLSVEHAGKFICTSSACLAVWHPLIVSSGSKPSGSVGSLGVIKRPDGVMQVTYKGEPLYTFVKDRSPGQATGQGFKDVGTWTVATPGGAKPVTPAASSSTSTSSGGGYAY